MRRFAMFLAAAASLAGCAQLAGIDNTTGGGGGGGGGDGGGVDGTPTGSSLAFTRFSIGATIVASPQSLDGTPLPVFNTASGPVSGVETGAAWTLGQPSTSVLFDAPDVSPRAPNLWQFPSINLQGFETALERPGAPVAAPAGETLDVELTLPTAAAAGEGFELFDIGAWSVTGLSATAGSATISQPGIAYTSFGTQSDQGLVAITTADAVLGLRYVGSQLTGASDSPGFAMTGADTVTATLAALPLNQTLNAKVDGPAAAARIAAAVPAFTATPSVSWNLVAAPGYALGQTQGVELNAAGGLPTDTSVNVAYSNPFQATRNWHSAFTWVMSASRTYTPTAGSLSGIPITPFAELATIREPGDGTTQDDASVAAGMPTKVILGGLALSSDGLALGVDPSTALTVAMDLDLPTNTAFQAEIIESTAVNGALQENVILTYLGTSSSFTLAPGTLSTGHTYRIRMFTIAGAFTDIASGDLTQRALPLSLALLDSGVFSVGTPQ